MPEYIFVGSKPDPAKFKPVKNGDGDLHPSVKATGGLWTAPPNVWLSILQRGVTTSYLLSHEELQEWRCIPRGHVRIFTISTINDLRFLLRIAGRTVHVKPRKAPRDAFLIGEWTKARHGVNGRPPRYFEAIDFEKLATIGWDAITLTGVGYRATRTSEPHLTGWDCPCTFWLGGTGWPFESVEPVAEKEIVYVTHPSA